jgi:hypothetical protein
MLTEITAKLADLKKQGLPEDSETPIRTAVPWPQQDVQLSRTDIWYTPSILNGSSVSTQYRIPEGRGMLYFFSVGASGTLTSENSSWPTALMVYESVCV